jgi:hypothetical protein
MSPFFRYALDGLFVALLGLLSSSTAHTDTIVVPNFSAGTIGEYTTSEAIAASGSNLFVASIGNSGAVGAYTTSGATVNSSLITHIFPVAIAIVGSDLFISDPFTGIGEYTTSGATVNASLISVHNADGIAVSGSDLL